MARGLLLEATSQLANFCSPHMSHPRHASASDFAHCAHPNAHPRPKLQLECDFTKQSNLSYGASMDISYLKKYFEPIRSIRLLTLAISIVMATLFVLWATAGKSAPPKLNDVRAFMEAKLEDSKKVLEGLTTENFELIVKNSQAMGLLSEDALWQVLQTSEYSQRSADFRRITDRLTEAARKKNLDGAALAYVELTMSCINCHKYVRDQNQGMPHQPK
jgi:hypothetical protein